MRAVRALVWKESREALPKVLIALGIGLLVCIMRQDADFNRNYSEEFEFLIDFTMIVMAVLLAMHAVAGERDKGTLSFLLGKPMGTMAVLSVKFVVGLCGLLLISAAAWATVYMDLAGLNVGQSHYEHNLTIVQDIAYVTMVALSFTTFALLYAFVFIGSAVTDNPFKGAAVGIGLAFVLAFFFEVTAPAIFPILGRYQLVEPGFNADGHLVRVAADKISFLVKILSNIGGVVAALLISSSLLRRYRGSVLEWRTVGIGWVVILVVISAAASALAFGAKEMPDGILEVTDAEAEQYQDLLVRGELAYLATDKGGFAIADLSDSKNPREIGRVEIDFWRLWGRRDFALVDSLIYAVGRLKGLPNDSLGVVIFDVADPASPRYIGRQMFEGVEAEGTWLRELLVTDDGVILVHRRGKDLVLQAFTFGVGQILQPMGSLTVSGGPDKEEDPNSWHRRFNTHLHRGYLYLGTNDELLVVDVRDLQAMRELSRVRIESYQDAQLYARPRLLAAEGDKLYVERFWPHELVEFDLADPANPREENYLVWRLIDHGMSHMQVAGGVLYGRSWDELKAWRIDESGALSEEYNWGVPERFKRGWNDDGTNIANGHLYIIDGGALMAYGLDE